MGGRGSGKTRASMEDAAHYGLTYPGTFIFLVAATAKDIRDTLVEGESGLLRIIPESLLLSSSRDRAWNRTLLQLTLQNGTTYHGFSSETPSRLRGPQCHRAYADELAIWRDANLGEQEDTTYSNLRLGLRLPPPTPQAPPPQLVVATTPRNVRLLKELLYLNPDEPPNQRIPNPHTTVSRMTTYDNAPNLAPAFRDRVLRRYEGTRAGRQEIHAQLIEDAPGALWLNESFRRSTLPLTTQLPPLSRITVAVDPAVTATETSDDTGIAVVARTRGPCPICFPDGQTPDLTLPHMSDLATLPAPTAHGFLLQDATCHLPASAWPSHVLNVYDRHEADVIVAEINNGGDLVGAAIHALRPTAPFTKVRASRGKVIRAEPVAGLFAQPEINPNTGDPTGRWLPTRFHLHGDFPQLQDQATLWDPNNDTKSPDRVDALVWGATHVLLDLLRDGGPASLTTRTAQANHTRVPTGLPASSRPGGRGASHRRTSRTRHIRRGHSDE